MILLVGLALMVVCLGLQSVAVVYAVQWFRRHTDGAAAVSGRWLTYFRVSVLLLLVAAGIIAQIVAWALLYWLGGALESFEDALYFSGVTFTSLGYGDVLLTGRARLLAPIEAMTGLLMFAIATAALIGAIQRLTERVRALRESGSD
ncbi:MAG: potassium channel family protein [Polymorphobacter sp.]